MKKILFFFLFVGSLDILKSQPTVSMLLLDEKSNAVLQKDVKQVNIIFYSPDSTNQLYQESFLNPQVTDGLINLNVGTGILDTSSKGYTYAVQTYFNSLPLNKRPTSETFLVIKVEVLRNNASTLNIISDYKINTPEPLIKGKGDKISYLDDASLRYYSFYSPTSQYVQNTIVDKDGYYVGAGLEYNIPDSVRESRITANRFNLSAGGNTIFNIDRTGLIFDNYVNKALVNRWVLRDSYFTGLNSNFSTPDAYKTRLGTDGTMQLRFNDNTDLFINGNSVVLKNETSRSKITAGELFLKKLQDDAEGWSFNLDGGSFKSGTDREFFLSRDFLNLIDKPSKRNTKLFYNGLTSYFDDKIITQIGANTSGVALFNFFRSNNTPAHVGSINVDNFFDQASYDPNGKIITRSSTVAATNGFNPFIYLTLDGGSPKAGFFVAKDGKGTVFGDVKNFRMDHPVYADKDIVYASLEGPEAAAYCRGEQELKSGSVFVPFPEHFRFVCSIDNLTVQLTPRSAKSQGLAVTSITEEGFQVEELREGHGNYKFFWEVKGIRKGYEQFQVIRPKSELQSAQWNNPNFDKK